MMHTMQRVWFVKEAPRTSIALLLLMGGVLLFEGFEAAVEGRSGWGFLIMGGLAVVCSAHEFWALGRE